MRKHSNRNSVTGNKMTRAAKSAKRRPIPSQSEVHAYVHILNELTDKKGWEKKNTIFTQRECWSVTEIDKLLAAAHAENVVKVSEKVYYVIEAKNQRARI